MERHKSYKPRFGSYLLYFKAIHVSGYKKIFIHDPMVTKDDFREMLKLPYEKFYTKNNYKQ